MLRNSNKNKLFNLNKTVQAKKQHIQTWIKKSTEKCH